MARKAKKSGKSPQKTNASKAKKTKSIFNVKSGNIKKSEPKKVRTQLAKLKDLGGPLLGTPVRNVAKNAMKQKPSKAPAAPKKQKKAAAKGKKIAAKS